ncbi:DegT/DnrJ/EryC1/StrS family aminotransferase [Lachnospiraceae bacterium 62-26]
MISLFSPLFYVDECLKGIEECLRKGWTGAGEKTAEFEKKWGEYTGYESAVFLNSATAGLMLTFQFLRELLGWQDNDEIITTPLTFVSTNHGILSAGLKPVFADVNNTLCLDPQSVLDKITGRTKAVIFVGVGGNIGDLKEISHICMERGIKLIVDAAHMSGTRIKEDGLRSLGYLADVFIYSFHATKVLSTADSGMVCCHDKLLEKKIRQKSWMGMDKSRTPWSDYNTQRWYYDVTDMGGSYIGNDIMAAIALAQYNHIESDIRIRHKIASQYKQGLKDCGKIEFIREPEECYSAQWLFQVVVPERDVLMEYLEKRSIFTGLHYLDNTQYKQYSYAKGTCPNAEYYSKHVISLPLHLKLSDENIQDVITTILDFYK